MAVDDRLVTCSIVRGELMFMAYRSRQSGTNLQRVRSFLASLEILEVGDAEADVYGKIKADIFTRFAPAVRKKPKLESLGFSENDLWIAATALHHGFTVVSADSDFTRIGQVASLAVDAWWRPQILG